MGWLRNVVLDWDLQRLQLVLVVRVDHHLRGRVLVLLHLFLQIQVLVQVRDLVLRCRILQLVL